MRAEQTAVENQLQIQLPAIHAAASGGHQEAVEKLLRGGTNVNLRDARGRTPLHMAAMGGHRRLVALLLKKGADINARDQDNLTPLQVAQARGHSAMADYLRNNGAQVDEVSKSGSGKREGSVTHTDKHAELKPSLEFKTRETFEKEIQEPAVLLDATHVCFFVPKRREKEARVIFEYLKKAYDELHSITGIHTEYKIAVYAFPKGNKHGWGGTSNCSIEYDDTNLALENQEEWKKYRKPHVSGYIEEMAHNFVHASKAQFGWEMVGWSLGVKVTDKVAGNPLFRRQLENTRLLQKQTFLEYVRNGHVFPKKIPANKCDRIHAWILYQCEEIYGPNFWTDFFSHIHNEKENLRKAASLGDDNKIRNARYIITIDCFNRLEKLHFKQRLSQSHISLSKDIKSLQPTKPGWNRRFQ
ncbi:MAG: ankyrin repeat domain-containing protein [Pirellulales bacterium]|nr:ankyrin repeat domain-containing protein [Pirellulales bacterium]